jgi:hypothetical protein
MKPHEQRVLDEHKELSEKIGKLSYFLTTPQFYELPLVQRHLLIEQEKAMNQYVDILEIRISMFEVKA